MPFSCSLDGLKVYNFTRPGPKTIWPNPTKAQISPERSLTSFIWAQVKPSIRLFTISSDYPIINAHKF
jgi:hypothetical protein